ncbi:MAG: beta-lactamase family protein [Thermomicrobiales bacterium]|nr:beta-lactamase family protein [Thermomicrobiales bacterium]
MTSISGIWQQIEDEVTQHHIGGAVALVWHDGDVVLHNTAGWAVREPASERTAMELDTIFDLASLTKVVATTPAVLQLVAQGKLALDEPVGSYIPEFGTEGAKREITIRNLLTHSSGIVSWAGIYTEAEGIDAYIDYIARTQPEAEPNSVVAYSCLGFITLGEVVHRLTGQTIAEYAHDHVFHPLGMRDTSYVPAPELLPRIAATEVGNPYEVEMANGSPAGGFRDYLIRGEVHDGNAWYGLGGISGNAGLFGTADDLLRYARMWLNGGELEGVRILPEELVREATQEHAHLASPNERRGLGWQMVPYPETPEKMASGRGLSEHAYGHTGFTGTSLWIDPDRQLITILLTNRVHPVVQDNWNYTRAAISAQLAELFTAGR